MRRIRDKDGLIRCSGGCGAKHSGHSRCKACQKEYNKAYRTKNAEKVRLDDRARYWRDPDKARRVKKESAKRTAPRVKERAKKWYDANPGHWRKYNVRKRKTWNKWAQANPGKVRDRRSRRKARVRGCKVIESFTRDEVFDRDQGCCRYCSDPLLPNWHLDHIVPLIRGGYHTKDNTVASCPACNLSKGTQTWIPNPIPEARVKDLAKAYLSRHH